MNMLPYCPTAENNKFPYLELLWKFQFANNKWKISLLHIFYLIETENFNDWKAFRVHRFYHILLKQFKVCCVAYELWCNEKCNGKASTSVKLEKWFSFCGPNPLIYLLPFFIPRFQNLCHNELWAWTFAD